MVSGEVRYGGLRFGAFATSLCMAASLVSLLAKPAEARHYFHRYHALRSAPAAPGGTPAEVDAGKYSAIVVDASTGREIWGVNENALRHPASLTKVMTLYMLFEQLEKGALTMSSRVPFSEHAAAQDPSKLGVRPGESISVDEAIKAVVTRSANDVAVAIAEKIGGSESNFATLMTHRAHELGMSRTLYRDASGLPNDEQLTTARDLALLGQTMQRRFPQYFHYFSLREFTYDGEVIGNHDHLLGRVEGVDGIKTGYTRASGFNLLTSVHRDGRALVAVVMGGISGPSRDRLMARLIETHIADASVGSSRTRFAEAGAPLGRSGARAVAQADDDEEEVAAAPARRDAEPKGEGDSEDEAPAPPVRRLPQATKPHSAILEKAAALDPARLGWRTGPQARKVAANAPPAPPKNADRGESRVARASEDDEDEARRRQNRLTVHVGSADDAREAREMLARAKSRHRDLASARAVTEKVRSHGDTLYRVAFAGLEPGAAQKACHDLKRGGFDCFTTRD